MKNKKFLSKFTLIGSFSFLIIVAIFIGCQKDFTTTDLGSTNVGVQSTSVSNYQKWFEAYTSNPENANFVIGKNNIGKIEPIWEKAVQIDEHLLDLPFKLNGGGLSQNISKGYKDSKVSLTLRANSNGSYKGFVIAISPKDDFVGSVDRINIQNFKTEKFDGIISIHDLSGKYLDGYFVKNGKIVAKIGNNSAYKSKNNSESMSKCCTEWCEIVEVTWCTCVCTSGATTCKYGGCSEPICETIWGGEVCWTDCSGCGSCPDPNNPACGDNCPDPNNPNCDNCPNPMNPNCNDSGDCLTGDCLNCALTPSDPRCCVCQNKSEKQTACQREFNFVHVTRLNVTVEVGLTSKNCRTGDATCSNNFYIFNPTIAEVNPAVNQVERWAIQPFPGTTNCGFNATYWSRGLITVTPKYLAAGETGDTKHFEGWPNFNIN